MWGRSLKVVIVSVLLASSTCKCPVWYRHRPLMTFIPVTAGIYIPFGGILPEELHILTQFYNSVIVTYALTLATNIIATVLMTVKLWSVCG